MKGRPWLDLTEAVKQFLKQRQDLGTEDRITAIKFTHKAVTEYFDQEVKDVNVDSIAYHGGRTDFSIAFAEVNQCITRSKTAASKYAIIFMSDGLAPFPEAELQTLVELHGNVIKKFWTLALG
ncbi:unnamed protein product, partial [Didymodactylos carnosus]